MDSVDTPAVASGKGRWQDIAFAASLANLIFIRAWSDLFSNRDFGYSDQISVGWTATLAFLLNLAWLAAVIFLVKRQARNRPQLLVRILAGAAFVLSLLLVANSMRADHFGHVGPSQLAVLKHPLAWLLALGLAAAAWRWRIRVLRVMVAGVVVLSPLVAWNVLRATLIPLHVIPLAQQAAELPRVAPRPGPVPTARVLWILFDEMDRRLAFDERPAGLRLPEFDRLRRESLDATNAVPPDRDTIFVIPALTIGRFVQQAKRRAPNELALTLQGGSEEVGWSTQATIFAEAAALGANVGVVGWYHPYHRLFPQTLSLGGWAADPGDGRGASLGEALQNQICSWVPGFQHRRTHRHIYTQARAMALDLVGRTNWGLAFLHLPVPHRPGIFDPATGRLTVMEFRPAHGYIGNLALADRTLGELRSALERAGTWDETWIIVSSDHWWRESMVYDGRVDARVPFLIRPPHGTGPRIFSERMNTVVTRELVLSMLRREVSGIEDVERWLSQHRVEAGPVRPP